MLLLAVRFKVPVGVNHQFPQLGEAPVLAQLAFYAVQQVQHRIQFAALLRKSFWAQCGELDAACRK